MGTILCPPPQVHESCLVQPLQEISLPVLSFLLCTQSTEILEWNDSVTFSKSSDAGLINFSPCLSHDVDIDGFKKSLTVNLFWLSGTCIRLVNDFQTYKTLNVAINKLFLWLEKWYHLSNITKILKSIFVVVQHDFSSFCIPVLNHPMNIWPDTQDL